MPHSSSSPSFTAALCACPDYNEKTVGQAVERAFSLSGYAPARGSMVLVKPNLLRADSLTCTHPSVVRAVCTWLLDRGVRVRVGDSPGFGTAQGVARAVGLEDALHGLGLKAESLGGTTSVPVPGLSSLKICRLALEADSILSVPKFKAHCQMRLTLAVKNLFGCVGGLHKALAHARHGDKEDEFPRFLAALVNALPPQAALCDGITAMHKTGPSGGDSCPLGLIAASSSAVALDTALYGLLGMNPADLPLWEALQKNGTTGAHPGEVFLAGDPPSVFPAEGFLLPDTLRAQSFSPGRLCISLVRRLLARRRS